MENFTISLGITARGGWVPQKRLKLVTGFLQCFPKVAACFHFDGSFENNVEMMQMFDCG